MNISAFTQHPNTLVQHYTDFRVSDRILLTGHSHQAWPDCAKTGQLRAWKDAAEYVDKKWDVAFDKAEQVKSHFLRLLDDDNGAIALGVSTHDLLVKFLSALPLRQRPKIVTTDSEFFTMRRQLSRLQQEGVDIIRVESQPYDQLSSKLIDALDNKTAALMVSSVFFNSGYKLQHLSELLSACQHIGAECLIDVYHQLNVVPFSISKQNLADAYIIGGGYKYCQLGEGNCFLRIPHHCSLTPIVTGWYSDFSSLEDLHDSATISYGADGDRFAGATYDPISHYRANEVFDFFINNGLTPSLLAELNHHQKKVLTSYFDKLDLDPKIIQRDRRLDIDQIGGFVSFISQYAEHIANLLGEQSVHVDFRGKLLRMGPAPYVSDQQIIDALDCLPHIVKSIKR